MNLPEERVIYRVRFQARHFDFRGKSIFTRFDDCEFVKCTLLIDHGTEHLAFTECVFKDCNIDKLEQDEKRGLYVRDSFFEIIGRGTTWVDRKGKETKVTLEDILIIA
jgi:hypothetical protein